MPNLRIPFLMAGLIAVFSQSAFANFRFWDCAGKISKLSGQSSAGSFELRKATLTFNGKKVDFDATQLNTQARMQEFDVDDLTILVVPTDHLPQILVFELQPPSRFDPNPRWRNALLSDTLSCELN